MDGVGRGGERSMVRMTVVLGRGRRRIGGECTQKPAFEYVQGVGAEPVRVSAHSQERGARLRRTGPYEGSGEPGDRFDRECQGDEQPGVRPGPVAVRVLGAAAQRVAQPPAPESGGAHSLQVPDPRLVEVVGAEAEQVGAEREVGLLEVEEVALVEAVEPLEERPAQQEERSDDLVHGARAGGVEVVWREERGRQSVEAGDLAEHDAQGGEA